MAIRRICVFCGASSGVRPAHAHTARAVGRALAARNVELVFGGGSVGLMGATADGALAAGGRAIGVIPGSLLAREVGHTGVTEMRVVETMHERKALMADLSNAFLILPGGFGTLDEFFECVTWAQLGFHEKPIGVLNSDRYFDPLLAFLRHAVDEGFVRREHLAHIVVDTSVDALLDRLLG